MKLLKLSSGNFSKVDDEDYQKIIDMGAWHENNHGYAYHSTSKGGKKRKIYLHRFLTSAEEGLVVDHINHDPLDNRKKNLRVCTHQENLKNRKEKARGYFYSNRSRKWVVSWRGKYGGRYNTIEEAQKALKHFKSTGEYAKQRRKRPMLPKGVRLMKGCHKRPFGAVVKENGKQKYLGYFADAKEAEKAYKEYWKKRNAIL